jgi:hypothetical protein
VGRGHGPILQYYPSILLEVMRKDKKNLNHDCRSPGPRFEPGISRIRSSSLNRSTTTFGNMNSEFEVIGERAVMADLKRLLISEFV